MIPFFRKIRYRLAKDNQFLKYSRYAIGEIVLVVVGILIALYINNWNEERKGIDEMEYYLNEVLNELKKDKVYLEAQISRNDSVLVKYSNYREKFNDSTGIWEIIPLQIQALSPSIILIFPSSTTIELVASIELIDPKLKRELLVLKNEQERLKRINELNIQTEQEFKDEARINGWNEPLAILVSTHQELREFLNYDERWGDLIVTIDAQILEKYQNSKHIIQDLKKMDQRLSALIEQIEQELNS